jgi:hypothetical protein
VLFHELNRVRSQSISAKFWTLKISRSLSLVLVIASLLCVSCSPLAYSTTEWLEQDRTINAPIETVWDVLIKMLVSENFSILAEDKNYHFILAQDDVSFFTRGTNRVVLTAQLIPRGPERTVVNIHHRMTRQLSGFVSAERLVQDLYASLKQECESTPIKK